MTQPVRERDVPWRGLFGRGEAASLLSGRLGRTNLLTSKQHLPAASASIKQFFWSKNRLFLVFKHRFLVTQQPIMTGTSRAWKYWVCELSTNWLRSWLGKDRRVVWPSCRPSCRTKLSQNATRKTKGTIKPNGKLFRCPWGYSSWMPQSRSATKPSRAMTPG